MKKFLIGAATAAAIFAANASSAITIQLDTFDRTAGFYGDVSDTTAVTGKWSSGSIMTYTGNLSGARRSPFDEESGGSSDGVDNDLPNAADLAFFSVGPLTNLSASLTFSEAQSSLSFLWGSPDDFNQLSFWLNGVTVATFAGTPVTTSGSSAGSALATFTGGLFDRVDFDSTKNAFEFASIQATIAPVPLPAGVWMLLAAIGGFGFVAHRKQRAAVAA